MSAPAPAIPAPAADARAVRAARSRSLDSDSLTGSLTGSLSDSEFASSSSTPPTVDTLPTSDDEQQHHHHQRYHTPPQMSDVPKPNNKHPVRPNPKRAFSASATTTTTSTTTTPNAYLSCSSSLLRTTLLAFARIGLATSSTCPTSSSSRRSSISYPSSPSSQDSLDSTGSPIDSPSLRAKSTTEIFTNSNPSLAQFSPTPPASSSLAMFSSSSTTASTAAAPSTSTHPRRTRSASTARPHHQTATATVPSGTRPRHHSLAFRPSDNGPTSPPSPPSHSESSSTRQFGFWRRPTPPHHAHVQPSAQTFRDLNASHAPDALDAPDSPGAPDAPLLPSISRAHVPDLVLPGDAHCSSESAASAAASNGFLKIDGSRDGLSCFRTPENGSGANIIVGTPRPSYPISLRPDNDDEVTVVIDSPVGDHSGGQPSSDGRQWAGKGKERATIPNEFYPPTRPLPPSSLSPTSVPFPPQPRQPRVKIVLPPPPVRASTTPKLKPRSRATPPTLTSTESASRLMRDRVHCASCAIAGVDFPRCPRCAEAWCSRTCRIARMEDVGDGRRKHVCHS